MLAGLGFDPFFAAGICLLANTAPVAFGSIGIPVTTLATVTGLPVLALSAMVGRLCAMISIIIPGYLIVVMSGWKRAIEVLPAIVACGVSFAGMQFFVSNYMGPELTDILSSLTCIVVMVLVITFWKPKTIMRLEGDKPITVDMKHHSAGELIMAWVAVPPARRVRPLVGQRRHQAGDQPLDRQPAAGLGAGIPGAEDHRTVQSHAVARPPQPDHPDAAGHRAARAVRRRLRVELAERLGHRLLLRRPRDRPRARRQRRRGS